MKKYIYLIITITFLGAIGNSVYQQINKKSAKSVRLECHKSSTVFEKVINPTLLKQLQNDIQHGNLKVTTEIEKATYMESTLFDFVDQEKIKKEFESLVAVNTSDNLKNSLNILIYENDKNDPGKKTAKSKLYAGYLMFSFKVDNTLVYKLQIDFFDNEGKDISKVLQCALKSILTIHNGVEDETK